MGNGLNWRDEYGGKVTSPPLPGQETVVNDGSVIANYLTNQGLSVPTQPILNDGTPVADNTGILASPAMAATQRPSAYQTPQIGMSEMLMRMGGAGMSKAADGGLAQMGAAIDKYGAIQDYNRSRVLEAYKAETDRLNKTNKTYTENQDQIMQFDQTLDNFEKAYGYLEQGGLTGLFDGTLGAMWDSATGNPEAGRRLLLERLRVDDMLLRVAQTKGAISNKEMEIFAKPAPAMTADESVWKAWVMERIEAIRSVRNKLAQVTGTTVRAAPNLGGASASQASGGNISAADSIVGIK